MDVDWRCTAMCYIQCNLLGIPAGITRGNSLTLKFDERWVTFAGVMHPVRNRSGVEVHSIRNLERAPASEPEVPAGVPVRSQLQLF